MISNHLIDVEACCCRLTRLVEAPKDYSGLRVHVMDRSGSKYGWRRDGDRLAHEVAELIATKPKERWLVVHHQEALGGRFKSKIVRLAKAEPALVSCINWGAHQGTNDYADVPNVILAGTLFYPESHYEGLALASSGLSISSKLSAGDLTKLRQGEHRDLILQALCRGAVRGSVGRGCPPCNAYIIASKGSGIRKELPALFPGCSVVDWKPVRPVLKQGGKVAHAVGFVERCRREAPDKPVLFDALMTHLGIVDRSNFRRTIREHDSFRDAMDGLGLHEVTVGEGRYRNALGRIFDPVPGATYTCAT